MNLKKEHALETAIGRLPRIRLGLRPTPLEGMPRLSEALGGPPLYVKRDDLTGLAFGGNKTRMLEFGMAEAKARGADTVVFSAAVQSNYCRQLSAACAKLGLELHLLLRPERPADREEVQGNHFLHRLFGARITFLEDNDLSKKAAAIAGKVEELEAEGRRVYIPRWEETVELDAIAYVEAALEIVRQSRELGVEFSSLYLASLDTTQAGLVLGLSYLKSSIQVRGFSPFQGMPERTAGMAQLANRAARRLGLEVEVRESDFENENSFVGERYAIPTQAGMEAIRTVARCEGILLDPVYTGKAMSGLFAHIREGKLSGGGPVLFVHTGGAPVLFGYVEDMLPFLECD